MRMKLPTYLFFTGVPGSRWSGIAQVLETLPGFNTSDRTAERAFTHQAYGGHQGSYFGSGMEFESFLNPGYINSAWKEPGGCRIVKSHEWAHQLSQIKQVFPEDWIMLVYRPDMSSYAWWHEAGGFNIKYPDYSAYKNSAGMLAQISIQNAAILEFACSHNLTWNYFTPEWIRDNFNQTTEVKNRWPDILVTLLK